MQFKENTPLYSYDVEREGGEDVVYVNYLGAPFVPSLVDSSDVMEKTIDVLIENPNLSPLDFLNASETLLRKNVFKSIVGHYWYLKLRGFETDDVEIKRKSFGQDYAIGKKTNDQTELSRILMKLCEKMGRRLRSSGNEAFGIHVGIIYEDWTYWHKSKKFNRSMFTTDDLFIKSMWIFNMRDKEKKVAKISVSCFELFPAKTSQVNLFDIEDKKRKLSDAMDLINDKYGEFIITPALMMNMDKLVLDRIAFGSTE